MSQPGSGKEVANDHLSKLSTDVLILFLQERHLAITLFTLPGTKLSQTYTEKEAKFGSYSHKDARVTGRVGYN